MKYYGKYRAIVKRTNDPDGLGRIKVECPKIYGETLSGWCLPCFSYGLLKIPDKNDGVWIEFEEGNVNYPIYVGTWYSQSEISSINSTNERIPFGTALKNWLDNHTHPISWTNASGSGNSSPPNGSSPDNSDVKIKR